MLSNLDDQTLNTDSSNLSEIDIESSEIFVAKNYANETLINRIVYSVLAESFDFSNYIVNYFSDIALNLQSNCIESSFEFKIFTILLIILILISFGIGIVWKIYGEKIDHFYKRQEHYLKTNSSTNLDLFGSKTKTK